MTRRLLLWKGRITGIEPAAFLYGILESPVSLLVCRTALRAKEFLIEKNVRISFLPRAVRKPASPERDQIRVGLYAPVRNFFVCFCLGERERANRSKFFIVLDLCKTDHDNTMVFSAVVNILALTDLQIADREVQQGIESS